MKKTGKDDFWQLQEYLPKETRTYVPSFLAVQYIFNFYEAHGIQPMKLKLDPKKVTFHKTAKSTNQTELLDGIHKPVFSFLNPQLLGHRVPKGTVYYRL